jgi:hypothetical protein
MVTDGGDVFELDGDAVPFDAEARNGVVPHFSIFGRH